MKKSLFILSAATTVVALFSSSLLAQNSSPFWSLAGNSNAESSSKFGTTNNRSVRFYTNNLQRMIINSAEGYIGIGIATPNSKLHINSPGSQTPLRVQVDGATKFFVDNEGGVSVGSSLTAPANGFFVSGNAGIGTNAPANKLHVRQSIANKAIEWQHETQADYWTVGIGINTLNCRFEFNGAFRGQISSIDGSYIALSDLHLKEAVEPMGQLMNKVMLLKPSKYFFKESRLRAPNKSLGFIAQEVEKLFPEIVYEFDGGYKGINYSAFAVVAIKAIQEQQENINEQQKNILDQKETIITLEDRISKLEAAISAITGSNTTALNNIVLEQNSPNPFRQSTTFRYKIPDGSRAQLNIYDVSGKLIKSLKAPAGGQVRVSGNELQAGNYIYTLIVNGKPEVSKKNGNT